MAGLVECCQTFRDMMDSRTAYTRSGEKIPLHSNVPLAYAQALFETVLRKNPAIVLEVGMAFGVSSPAILSALREAGRGGRLISIDPVQSSQWNGCGLEAVSRSGLSEHHELIEDYDYNALPRLLASGVKLDLAYIDGWHTFDYTFIDWWYIDKMLSVDGIVGFNDCYMPAVDKVIRFLLTHRKYTEIDVGLPVTLDGYGRKRELLRRLTFGRLEDWYCREEDRYFRKVADWEPDWNFFAPF